MTDKPVHPHHPEAGDPAARAALSAVVERNIRTIRLLRAQAARDRSVPNRIADTITGFSGSLVFVYFHVVWFGLWIVLNTGQAGLAPFDPYPYGLLTMVVSLEAIFLSTFVLISQNRMGAEADRQTELDLQVDLLTETKLTRVIKMLHEIQDRLGIDCSASDELADLELATNPEDVLAEIERASRRHQHD